MKIALVLLNETVAKFNKSWVSAYGRMAYAPTTLTQLAALVPEHLNADIQLIDEGVSFFNAETIDADLVGLSVLTPNAPRAYNLAAILKRRGISVVMGGVHPTLLPEEAAKHADAVVIGFAENSWPLLLEDFARNRLQKIYKYDYSEVFSTSLPNPRYDLQKKRKYILPYTLESTRGCLNKCTFCVVSNCSDYSNFVTRDIDSVISQIQSTKAKQITFLDSSPAENLDYIKNLYRRLIPLNVKWKSNITLKVAENDEWLQLASKSGCNGVLIGFESLNQDSLTDGNKNFNQVNRYKEVIRKLHQHKISVFACFVFGFDNDTSDVFRRTLDFVNDAKIDLLNYTLLTPYPQTAIYNQLKSENRIMEFNWQQYNGAKVVFRPKNMTAHELQKGFEWTCLRSYSTKSIAKRLLPPRNLFGLNITSNIYISLYNRLRFK